MKRPMRDHSADQGGGAATTQHQARQFAKPAEDRCRTQYGGSPSIRAGERRIDWIVMKCLEKDRARRYESASSLARDVQRHLADEPVEACPPSASYRLRKAARRHKVPLAVASRLHRPAPGRTRPGHLGMAGRAGGAGRCGGGTARGAGAGPKDRAGRGADERGPTRPWIPGTSTPKTTAGPRPRPSIPARPGSAMTILRSSSVGGTSTAAWACGTSPLTTMPAPSPSASRTRPRNCTATRCCTWVSGDEAGYRGPAAHARAVPREDRWPDRPGAGRGEERRRGDALLAGPRLRPGPRGVPEYDRLLRLADMSAASEGNDYWVPLYVRGAACYRAGRFEEAVRLLRDSCLAPVKGPGTQLPVPGDVPSRLDKADEARQNCGMPGRCSTDGPRPSSTARPLPPRAPTARLFGMSGALPRGAPADRAIRSPGRPAPGSSSAAGPSRAWGGATGRRPSSPGPAGWHRTTRDPRGGPHPSVRSWPRPTTTPSLSCYA